MFISNFHKVLRRAALLTLAAVNLPALGETGLGPVVSDELVPIQITRSAISCTDKTPNNGYGAHPGFLLLIGQNFDSTGRVPGEVGYQTTLPDSTTCNDLKALLASVPTRLEAHRILTRFNRASRTHNTWGYRAQIEILLPFRIKGEPAKLMGVQEWTELTLALNEKQPIDFPFTEKYTVLAHPQAVADGGMHCKSETFSTGYLSGTFGIGDRKSNVEYGRAKLSTPEKCEEVRSKLLEVYEAIDPTNIGTKLSVSRTIDHTYREAIDERGKHFCQLVQLDTVTSNLRGLSVSGARTFPLREVAMENCEPN